MSPSRGISFWVAAVCQLLERAGDELSGKGGKRRGSRANQSRPPPDHNSPSFSSSPLPKPPKVCISHGWCSLESSRFVFLPLLFTSARASSPFCSSLLPTRARDTRSLGLMVFPTFPSTRRQGVRQQGDEDPHARSGCCRKDEYVLSYPIVAFPSLRNGPNSLNPFRPPPYLFLRCPTAILYKLKLNQQVTTIPTVGFNVETVTYKNVKVRFRCSSEGGRGGRGV